MEWPQRARTATGGTPRPHWGGRAREHPPAHPTYCGPALNNDQTRGRWLREKDPEPLKERPLTPSRACPAGRAGPTDTVRVVIASKDARCLQRREFSRRWANL